MKCRRARTLIFDFIDGLIGDSDRVKLEQHLGECPRCDREAQGLRKSLALLHRAPQVKPDENFNWKVRLAIQRERDTAARQVATQGAWARAWNARFVAGAAAAFAVVTVVGFLAGRAIGPAGVVSNPAFTNAASSQPSSVAKSMDSTPPTSNPVVDPRFRQDLVSSGSQPEVGPPVGLIQEDEPMTADNLTTRFLLVRTRQLEQRSHALEDQVKLLQSKLIECQGTGANE
jgi:anti-sigma factor RsiW